MSAQLPSDVDDPKNRETFTGKMSVGRRRFNEKMGQKMGKDATDDAEFAERHTRVMELAKKIEKVKLSMKRQLDASRSLCLAAADLGNACSDADVRDVQFQNIQYQLDESIRKTLDENLMQALESLDKKLAPFKDLDKRVKARSNLKLDYDHYVRKVRDLKEKSNADPAKLTNNEVKLEKAKNRVHQATATCYKVSGHCLGANSFERS
jgi:DNA repair ATPase RecN